MNRYAQATALADLTEFGSAASIAAGRCAASGLDASSYRGILGAALVLGSPPMAYMQASWANDNELISCVFNLAGQIHTRHTEVTNLHRQVIRRLEILYATVPADEDARQILLREIALCEAALEILAPLPRRLTHARQRLTLVPVELGETYAAAYALLAGGHAMPHNGRWITGEGTTS